ncbi:MAG: LacI family transcriptional regulator [Acidimicrobiia bacterium]|nr:MAG: LacI family transcriptional regulator [Acidimicrobiia bacterium]
MKEVARRAGVALSSVSRVLNDHPDVSDAMRAKVIAAIKELGYQPNLVASSLRRGSTKTVGFVVADISNPLFADITWGAERRLNRAGYSMVLTNSEGDPARDEKMVRLLRRRRVDGLIISLADETRKETIAELKHLEVPIVLIDREVGDLASASAVLADHAEGMRRATELLFDLGHRRIGLIGPSESTRPGRERLAGFKAAHSSRRVGVDWDLVKLGGLSPAFGEAMAHELLNLKDPPSALISAGNLLLVGTLRALHRARVSVGSEISLVSCDDVPLAELYNPPITVVDRNTVEMGEIAAGLLLERLEDPEAKPRVATVPTRLIVRASTAAAR